MRHFFSIVAVAFFAATSHGQTVSKIELAKDNGKGHPGTVVKDFGPKDSPIHCVIHLQPLPAPIVFTGTLIASNVASVKKNFTVATTNISGAARMDFLDFKFSLPRPWPVGSYKVEVKANGKLLKDVSFDIK